MITDPDGALLGRTPGLPDDVFEHDGLITKRHIRACALALLRPRAGELLWDLGAGAGWITPSNSTKVFRATLCACLGASSRSSTGAKQTSVASMISHHSAWVFWAITWASLSRRSFQAPRSIWAAKAGSLIPVFSSSSA